MTETPPAPPRPEPRFGASQFRDLTSFRRARDKRMIAGVAEGLSRHFDIDPIIVRVLFGALLFFGGAGLILYLACWLTVPEEGSAHSILSGRRNRDTRRVMVAGLTIGAAAAGVVMFGSIGWAAPHPALVVVVAVLALLGFVVLSRRHDERWPPDEVRSADPVAPSAPSSTDAPGPAERSAPSSTDASGPAEPSAPSSTEAPGPAESAQPSAVAAPVPPAWWQRPAPAATREAVAETEYVEPDDSTIPPWELPPPPPPPPPPRSHLFGLTMAAVAIGIGVVWIADAATPLDVAPSVYPGLALAIVAAALVLGTWWGRSRGLIVVGFLIAPILAVTAIVGPGPYGEQIHVPKSSTAVQDHYHIGAGHLVVRLDQVPDIQNLEHRTIDIDGSVGAIQVVVPTSLNASINAKVDVGDIRGLPGVQDHSGSGVEAVVAPKAPGPATKITIHLKLGEIDLDRVDCPGYQPWPGQITQTWMGGNNAALACS